MSYCFELKNQQIKSILHQNEFIRDGEILASLDLKSLIIHPNITLMIFSNENKT